jgi:cytoskeletal protein RodZ
MLGALFKFKVIIIIIFIKTIMILLLLGPSLAINCHIHFLFEFNFSDMESARCPQPKIPSPTSSAVSKGELKISPVNEGAANIQDTADVIKAVSAPQQASEHVKIPRAGDVSEATHESMSVKEPVSQGSAPVVEEEVQQKLVPTEAGNVDCCYFILVFFGWC